MNFSRQKQKSVVRLHPRMAALMMVRVRHIGLANVYPVTLPFEKLFFLILWDVFSMVLRRLVLSLLLRLEFDRPTPLRRGGMDAKAAGTIPNLFFRLRIQIST